MQLKKIVLSAVMTVIALSGEAKGLALKVYNPGTSAIFPVTSTIVYGKKDAALIDAQFQKQYASVSTSSTRLFPRQRSSLRHRPLISSRLPRT